MTLEPDVAPTRCGPNDCFRSMHCIIQRQCVRRPYRATAPINPFDIAPPAAFAKAYPVFATCPAFVASGSGGRFINTNPDRSRCFTSRSAVILAIASSAW